MSEEKDKLTEELELLKLKKAILETKLEIKELEEKLKSKKEGDEK